MSYTLICDFWILTFNCKPIEQGIQLMLETFVSMKIYINIHHINNQ